MTHIFPKKYESQQKERFDTLFNDVLTSYAITNESHHQLKSTRVLIENYSEQISDLNKQYEHSLIRYGKDYSNELSQINSHFQDSVKRQESLYTESLKMNKKSFQEKSISSNKQIKDIQQSLQNTIKQINIDIYRAVVDMRQRHQELDLEFEKYKKEYRTSIVNIEDQKQTKIDEIKLNHEIEINENKNLEQVRQFKLNQELQKLQKERQIEQADFDESTIKIKTIFNRTTVKFNQKIRDIQKQFQQKMGSFENEINLAIEKVNQQIERLKTTYSDQDRAVLDSFEQALNTHDKSMEQLKKEYLKKRDKITKLYTKDITINNTKLASYKDVNVNQQRHLEHKTSLLRKEIKQTDDNFQALTSEINRNFIKQKRVLDKELRNQIVNTSKQNSIRRKKHQKELLMNEYDYIQRQEKLRLFIKAKTFQKDHLLYVNKESFNSNYQVLMAEIRFLERKLFSQNQIFKEQQLIKIYPYESEVLLAREAHDTEINYRTLENNHFKQNQSLHEKKTLLLSNIDELTLKKEKDRMVLSNQYDLKQTSVVSYLKMEYEKNSLTGDQRVISEKKKEQELYFQKQELTFIHKRDLEKERLQTEQNMIDFKQKMSQQVLEINENKALIDHDATIELAKINYTRETGIRKARRIIDTSLTEIQRQRKLIDIYFQMMLSVIQEHDYFLIFYRDIYTTSSTEEFEHALTFLKELFESQSAYKDSIIDSLESEIVAYYQEKIDELTEFKYMTLKESISEEYESEKSLYLTEIANLENQLKIQRSNVADLYQQIAVIQNNNDNINQTKSLIHKQIEKLGMHPLSKQNKKTAQNLRKELKFFQKEIIKNNTEIQHLSYQIKQINRDMQQINRSFKPLNQNIAQIEVKKHNRERQLDKSQYTEGKIYYDAIEEIKALTKAVKQSFDKHYQTVYKCFNRAKDPQFKDDLFKLTYKKLHASFDKTKHSLTIYHKKGIIMCDNQHKEIQKEQHRIIQEYESSYRLTSLNIGVTTEKRQYKLHQKLIELEKYKKSFAKIQQKQLDNQISLLKDHYKEKMAQLDAKLENAKKDIQRAYEYKASFLSATDANIASVISEQNQQFKVESGDIDSAYSIQLKDVSDKIQSINRELITFDTIFNNKIEFYASKEKQSRKRITDILYENRANSRKSIRTNREHIETLSKKTELLKFRVKSAQKRLEKHNSLHYKYLLIWESLQSKIRIKKRNRAVKHTFKQKKS
ncbi:MAG: hypothetical protein RBQ91_01145 [Acholeplasma sp.]|nr:hypothetical protein [Acholeplasma sp.]